MGCDGGLEWSVVEGRTGKGYWGREVEERGTRGDEQVRPGFNFAERGKEE